MENYANSYGLFALQETDSGTDSDSITFPLLGS